MDAYDRNILKWLQDDGRITNVELAERIHLSAPQTLRRVRTLEESGVIRRYAALVSPAAVGLEVMAFVSLSLDRGHARNVREMERNVMAFPEVIECHSVSGDFDYLLKVVAADLKSLSLFLTDRLIQVPGVTGVRSTICLEEIKAQSSLPT
jgi:Lrp/AsnC family leucine-responsive transcriptional regulator